MEDKLFLTPQEAGIIFACLAVVNDITIYNKDTDIMTSLYDKIASWEPFIDYVKAE